MVTEANPNVQPQSHSPTGDKSLNNNINATGSSSNVYFVGLEFVRQYYTVMNQGPLYLHRFYSEDSSFVHGMSARDSKVVYGQQEIHKRIQSLNFRNCHAKIRQVDSHETVGNGVVIQVTGELSNNGQPMRRFMQTFVLAPQSPKRYYVRNDIFHYQDEVFCDDDADAVAAAEGAVDNEDADEQEAEEEVAVVSATGGTNLDNVINNLGLRSNVTTTAGASSPGLANDVNAAEPVAAAKPEVQVKPVEAVVVASPQVTSTVPNAVAEETVSVVSVTRSVEEETVVVNAGGSGPKTYANLFKNNTSTVSSTTTVAQATVKSNGPSVGNSNMTVNVADGGITSPPQTSPQPNITAAKLADKGLPPRNPRPSGGFNRERQDRDGRGDRGDRDGRQNDRERREPRERLPSRSSTTHNTETGSVDGDRDKRPVNTYPDANQLFVGNLPHTVSQSEIREIFSEYGEIADVKIQKPAPKGQGSQKVPWFAFVVFDEPASAQAVLRKATNIRMKMAEGGERRLNVEEKRSRPNVGNPGGGYGGFGRDGSAGAGHAGMNNQGSNIGGGSGHGRGYGSYGGDQRGSAPPTHSRTFRGSNRGGGNQGGGGDRGGRGHNSGGVNASGGFQGGRASPNRNYNNNNKR